MADYLLLYFYDHIYQVNGGSFPGSAWNCHRCATNQLEEITMSITAVLIFVVVLVLLFGGGGGYWWKKRR